MNLTKHRLYKTPQRFRLLLLAGLITTTIVFGTSAKSTSAAAVDCSDVYSPLSSSLLSGVDRNKSAYLQVMNETGVPWEMLAAIHYRETNFSRTNPGNGYGIFQFTPPPRAYPPGVVSDAEFLDQLRYMANRLQSDYVSRGSAPRERRQLVANEQNIAIVKDTLFSYNGRAAAYANQAATFGYNSTTQPYEGSPYVMNRFDCPRARMGIITQDYATGINSTDTRYGAFTVFARLRGDTYWLNLQKPYQAQYVTQSSYPALRQNDSKRMYVQMRNTGARMWKDQLTAFPGAPAIKLATINPLNRGSYFQDATWQSYNRPTATLARVYESDGTTLAADQHTVFPGQVGRYEFTLKTYPNTPGGIYQEWFQLIAEGDPNWDVNGSAFFYNVTVDNNLRTARYRRQSSYPTTSPSEKTNLFVEFENSGTVLWKDQLTAFPGAPAIKVATTNPVNRTTGFQDSSWQSASRPTATLARVYESDGTTLAADQHTVFPGQVGRYEFTLSTPPLTPPGTYQEWFQLIAEGDPNWSISGSTSFFNIYVNSVPQVSYVSQSAYPTIQKGQSSTIFFRYRNSGNVTLNSSSTPQHSALTTTLSMATTTPINRQSNFSSSWFSPSRPSKAFSAVYSGSGQGKTSDQNNVRPGQEFAYEFNVTAPSDLSPGTYREWFQPVRESANPWDIGGVVFMDITVTN